MNYSSQWVAGEGWRKGEWELWESGKIPQMASSGRSVQRKRNNSIRARHIEDSIEYCWSTDRLATANYHWPIEQCPAMKCNQGPFQLRHNAMQPQRVYISSSSWRSISRVSIVDQKGKNIGRQFQWNAYKDCHLTTQRPVHMDNVKAKEMIAINWQIINYWQRE